MFVLLKDRFTVQSVEFEFFYVEKPGGAVFQYKLLVEFYVSAESSVNTKIAGPVNFRVFWYKLLLEFYVVKVQIMTWTCLWFDSIVHSLSTIH